MEAFPISPWRRSKCFSAKTTSGQNSRTMVILWRSALAGLLFPVLRLGQRSQLAWILEKAVLLNSCVAWRLAWLRVYPAFFIGSTGCKIFKVYRRYVLAYKLAYSGIRAERYRWELSRRLWEPLERGFCPIAGRLRRLGNLGLPV